MIKKYKVTFEIEGEMLADDVNLTKENLKMVLKKMDITSANYYGNRGIDTQIKNLKIEGLSII